MEEKQFLKKYLGEITLKNGEHVKFLFPVSKDWFNMCKIEAESVYSKLTKKSDLLQKYQYAAIDNLNKEQFCVVFAAVKKYGEKYWVRLWNERNKK